MNRIRIGETWKAVKLLTTRSSNPKRGEIWLVDFNPTKGAEINKVRNALVISSDAVGVLPIKLVVPITTWNDSFADKYWLVKVAPSTNNGLTQDSAIDTLQIRSVDVNKRFIKKIGFVPAITMEEICTSVAIIIEYS
jgi:mRNA interferase MazF